MINSSEHQNKTISCIVFDFGGVISLKQNENMAGQICTILGITPDQYRFAYQVYRNDYDAARITAADYWRMFLDLIGISRPICDSDLQKIVTLDSTGWLDMNPRTINLIENLHRTGYPLAILSNMTVDTLPLLRHKAAWLGFFGLQIFSCEHKQSKPDEAIFRILLSKAAFEPSNILFIDDSPANVSTAQKLGMNAIHFESNDQLKSELENTYRILE
jgi:putative hydrolase of the HAD superfamily